MVLADVSPDVVVVCPRKLHDALADWVAWREGQGHAIAIVEPGRDAETTRARIRQVDSQRRRYLLLVGDAPAAGTQQGVPSATVPTHYQTAKINFGNIN